MHSSSEIEALQFENSSFEAYQSYDLIIKVQITLLSQTCVQWLAVMGIELYMNMYIEFS